MRDDVVIGPTIGAIGDPVAVGDLKASSFVVDSMHFWNNQVPALVASGITGAEEVGLWRLTAGTWVRVFDGAGTASSLTATNPQMAIISPGTYGLTKSAGVGITVTIQMP